MTGRERVLSAMAHCEPDHVPMDIGAHGSTGIHQVAYLSLRRYLGLEERPVRVWHTMQQLADVDEDLLAIAGGDARRLGRGNPSGWQLEEKDGPDGAVSYTDEFGITFMRPLGGLYYDPRGHPLVGAASVADVESFPWPDATDPARYAGMRARASQLRDSGAAVCLGSICAGPLEMGLWLRGFDRFMMDLALEPAIAQAIVQSILRIKLDYWNTALPLLGDLVDVAGESEDLGGQGGLLISRRLYVDLLKPAHSQVFRAIRSHTDAAIYLHSCGAVRELIPDFIEMGVDALNPVQVSAAGMDTRELKRDFGKDIVFWGGGCDTQTVLSQQTPSQVRDEVMRRIDDLAPGGGFVFTPVHNIQADVPPENVVAMWDAWSEHGVYH